MLRVLTGTSAPTWAMVDQHHLDAFITEDEDGLD